MIDQIFLSGSICNLIVKGWAWRCTSSPRQKKIEEFSYFSLSLVMHQTFLIWVQPKFAQLWVDKVVRVSKSGAQMLKSRGNIF